MCGTRPLSLAAYEAFPAANQRGQSRTGCASGHQRRHRTRLGDVGAVVLGVPFGPWTAHVVQLGPIGVEQRLGQTLEEVDDVEGKLRILAVSGELASYGRCPDHGAIRLGRVPLSFDPCIRWSSRGALWFNDRSARWVKPW